MIPKSKSEPKEVVREEKGKVEISKSRKGDRTGPIPDKQLSEKCKLFIKRSG